MFTANIEHPVLKTELHRWRGNVPHTLLSSPTSKGVIGMCFKSGQGGSRNGRKSGCIEGGTEYQARKLPSVTVQITRSVILELPVVVILSGEGPYGCRRLIGLGSRSLQPLLGILLH